MLGTCYLHDVVSGEQQDLKEVIEYGEQDNDYCSYCGNKNGVMLIVEPDDPYLSTTICRKCLIEILDKMDAFNKSCSKLRLKTLLGGEM